MEDSKKKPAKTAAIQPRLIRLHDAPAYLGMDKNRFNSEVRPRLIEIPIGKQGIAFDRLEMDAWVEHYKACNGRPASAQGEQIWDVNKRQDYENAAASGTLRNKCLAKNFSKALARATSKKRS